MTNTFRGQNSTWKSTVTNALLIQCFKHRPRRRVDKNTSRSVNVFEVAPDPACANRFVLSRRYPASHAEISNHRVRCTFDNNMRNSNGHFFVNQQATRIDNVFLSIASSSISDWHTLHDRVTPVQDSSVPTFVRRSYSSP